MLSFDEIWPQFEWILEDMRSGVAFFEGYSPSIGRTDLLEALSEVSLLYPSAFQNSFWLNHSNNNGWPRMLTPAGYVELFKSGKIITLSFEYGIEVRGFNLSLRILFEPNESETSLEILCYREPILNSGQPKAAVEAGIIEFRRLYRIFRGDALFLGPDTSNYPRTPDDYPDDWLRID